MARSTSKILTAMGMAMALDLDAQIIAQDKISAKLLKELEKSDKVLEKLKAKREKLRSV
jgi:hypothetical protein